VLVELYGDVRPLSILEMHPADARGGPRARVVIDLVDAIDALGERSLPERGDVVEDVVRDEVLRAVWERRAVRTFYGRTHNAGTRLVEE
jgi:hypothetical protein